MSKEIAAASQEITEPEANSATSWLEVLPEEMRSAPSLTKFKDVSTLAQSYLEAEKVLNSRVAVPSTEAPDEEWSKFYSKLGLPEDKKYTDKRSAEDEEYLKAYEEMFYQQGLSKRQGQKLLESMYKFSADLQKRQAVELEQTRTSNFDWLKSNYGDSFDSKMTLMQAALSKFGSKELAGLIEETSYSPALVNLLVKVGETLKSDSLITGSHISANTSPDHALAEIKRLESDSDFMVKLRDKNHAAHDEAVRKLEELYKIAYDKK